MKQKRREWEEAHSDRDNVIIMEPFEPLQYVWRFEWEQEPVEGQQVVPSSREQEQVAHRR